MDLFSAQFFSALLAIVIIDLVLAGDNAIVIALAARKLPAHLRSKAIMWGTVGAIVVRSSLTVVVVWLLKIPGLLLIGGALLVWIAYKLLLPEPQDEGAKHSAADSFWGAMKTIVIADAVMGLDNVLAVAGAAQGSFLLVVLGLLISIPIVIGGSQIILKFVDRFPAIVYVGAGVLAWTAAKMMMSEPLIKDYFVDQVALSWMVYAIVVGGVLGAGMLVNRRRLSQRVAAHVVDLAAPPAAALNAGNSIGATHMLKVLVPVDGSENSQQAVRHVVNRRLQNPALEVHLLHVRTRMSRHIARFLNKRDLAAYHRQEADKALLPARQLLDSFGVPHACHMERGVNKATTIDRVARRLRVDQIVMGTARRNSLTRLIEDSVANQVIETSRVPVEIVAGREISRFERYGLPAGLGTALALLVMATD